MIPIIELQNISRRYGNIQAVRKADFTLFKSEIHSIVGGNGAGKSTLMKILYGIVAPDSGRILFEGREVDISHPKDAIKNNIGMVPQEILLVETRSIVQNIILGSEPCKQGMIDNEKAVSYIRQIVSEHDINIDLTIPLNRMTVGEKQKVLIIRALYNRSRILILDEPTASLTPKEVEDLFRILRSLKNNGTSIIFISHKIPEVLAISDRITIMSNGSIEGTVNSDKCSYDELMELICGTKLEEIRKDRTLEKIREKPVFEIRNIESRHGLIPLSELSIKVFSGEILGLIGVDGNGQKELEEIISGQVKKFGGQIFLKGESITDNLKAGSLINEIGYIPSEREKNGLISGFSIEENVILGKNNSPAFCNRGLLNLASITEFAESVIMKYDIKPSDPKFNAGLLSGGNQQKIVLGREQSESPEILIACNPTRGIDISTTNFLFRELRGLSERGAGILLMLNDIEDAVKICDRISVLYNGRIIKEFIPEKTDILEIGYYMTGGIDE